MTITVGVHEFIDVSILTCDSTVAGQQYADICEMLLVLHDPRTPTTGLGRMEASRDIEHKVKKLVRRICGVALSNKKHLPAMSTAGISIVTCKHGREDETLLTTDTI
jgi:hypothetical protein